MARFNGKKVIKTKVADGIHKAAELLERANNGNASVYHHDGSEIDSNEEVDSESIGRKLYKHLMNGVSPVSYTHLLMDNDFKESLISCKNNDEFLRLIDKKEKEKYGEEKNEYNNSDYKYKILAVTACPTGIAHTYICPVSYTHLEVCSNVS